MTRPEPGLRETMQAIAAMGLVAVACPMLRIRPRRPRLPEPSGLDAIMVTSGQAVGALARAAAADPAWFQIVLLGVGDRTAQRAREAGFGRVASAAGDADALAALAGMTLAGVKRPGRATILLASGARQGLGLAAGLRAGGWTVHRRVAYAAHPVAALPAAARAALAAHQVRACLFFSAETADAFVRALPEALHARLAAVDALAIGAPAARVLGALPWQSIVVAPRPQATALLGLLQAPRPPSEASVEAHHQDTA
ncbi:uroporphyrinogen-III synthase [Lichenicoccus sp.]|uniref:uroporphyrinogen-III synthase n=1 Tax=Lichenicoccus sp. TaxID=2781899 RepID=UPI003D15320C